MHRRSLSSAIRRGSVSSVVIPMLLSRRLTRTQSASFAPYSIVGVVPPGLDYPVGVDYWIPIGGGQLNMNVVARLKPDVAPETARSEFLSIVQALDRERTVPGSPTAATLRPLTDAVLGLGGRWSSGSAGSVTAHSRRVTKRAARQLVLVGAVWLRVPHRDPAPGSHQGRGRCSAHRTEANNCDRGQGCWSPGAPCAPQCFEDAGGTLLAEPSGDLPADDVVHGLQHFSIDPLVGARLH